MNQGRIIVITGSPGTGKTTTASIVAKESDMDKSVHMHTDDFFHYLSKGAIPPHLPESNEQNLVVIEAFLEAAKRYARGGYDVIVDGLLMQLPMAKRDLDLAKGHLKALEKLNNEKSGLFIYNLMSFSGSWDSKNSICAIIKLAETSLTSSPKKTILSDNSLEKIS